MKRLVLVALMMTACSVRAPVVPPYSTVRDPVALAQLALQEAPLAQYARKRLLHLADWSVYHQPIDLSPSVPLFRLALRSPKNVTRRRALHLLGELVAIWSYGFEVRFMERLPPDTYQRPFVEPLIPELVGMIREGPSFMRYEALDLGLAVAQLLVLMDNRNHDLEGAMREAREDDDTMVAQHATHAVQALETLLQTPVCRHR